MKPVLRKSTFQSNIAIAAYMISWERAEVIYDIVMTGYGNPTFFEPIADKLLEAEQEAFSGISSNAAIARANQRYPAYPENWSTIREEVLIRDGYQCGNCGSPNNLHVHHIVPLSKGGSNRLTNLRTLCEQCHKKLHPHMR